MFRDVSVINGNENLMCDICQRYHRSTPAVKEVRFDDASTAGICYEHFLVLEVREYMNEDEE